MLLLGDGVEDWGVWVQGEEVWRKLKYGEEVSKDNTVNAAKELELKKEICCWARDPTPGAVSRLAQTTNTGT